MVAWLTQGSASDSVCLRSCGLDGHWEVVPRGVSGAVSPQWIPLWFLTLLSRLHYLSREKEGRQLSQTPLDGPPPAPDKWLCATGAKKKSSGWGGSDYGSQGGEEGYWLGPDRHGDYMHEFFSGERKVTQREKRKRTLGEVWHSAESERRVNREHQRGRQNWEKQWMTDLFPYGFYYSLVLFLFYLFNVVRHSLKTTWNQNQLYLLA